MAFVKSIQLVSTFPVCLQIASLHRNGRSKSVFWRHRRTWREQHRLTRVTRSYGSIRYGGSSYPFTEAAMFVRHRCYSPSLGRVLCYRPDSICPFVWNNYICTFVSLWRSTRLSFGTTSLCIYYTQLILVQLLKLINCFIIVTLTTLRCIFIVVHQNVKL